MTFFPSNPARAFHRYQISDQQAIFRLRDNMESEFKSFVGRPMTQEILEAIKSRLRVVMMDVANEVGWNVADHFDFELLADRGQVTIDLKHKTDKARSLLQLLRASETKIYEEVEKSSELVRRATQDIDTMCKEVEHFKEKLDEKKRFVAEQDKAIQEAARVMVELNKRPTLELVKALAHKWRQEGEFWYGTDEDRARNECADDLLLACGLEQNSHVDGDLELVAHISPHVQDKCAMLKEMREQKNAEDMDRELSALYAEEAMRKEGDELLEKMQTPTAKEAAKNLFTATPQELGEAAVKGAQRDLLSSGSGLGRGGKTLPPRDAKGRFRRG